MRKILMRRRKIVYWRTHCTQSTHVLIWTTRGRIHLKVAHCWETAQSSPFFERLGQTDWVKSIFQTPSFHFIIMWNEMQSHRNISRCQYYARWDAAVFIQAYGVRAPFYEWWLLGSPCVLSNGCLTVTEDITEIHEAQYKIYITSHIGDTQLKKGWLLC